MEEEQVTTPGTGQALPPEEVLALAERFGTGGPQVTEGASETPILMPGERPPLAAVPSAAPEYKAVNPHSDPAGAQRLADIAMGKDDAPIVAPRPPMDEIELPGGWLDREGKLQKKVRIRELNGADEEELAKPYQRTVATFVDTIVKRCVVDIGGQKVDPRQFDDMLIGDREQIVIQVRVLTYGPTTDLNVNCPACKADFLIQLDLEKDIPVKNLPGPDRQRTFEVTTPRGEICKVNLMTGGAQLAAFNAPEDEFNTAEQTSIMLKECVFSINDEPVSSMEQVRSLSAGSRRTLTQFLVDNTCGPQWQAVMQECPNCQASNPLPLSLTALFL